MSKKLKYTSSKSQPIENSSNFVELEPELFLNSKEFYKIIQTNYKKNNNQDIIFTPKSKSDKNNSSKSKDIDYQKIKVNIPLSTKNLTNIKLNFNDNIENKENKNMGIGDWGLGMGDWGFGPIPNPQSPIPNPQSPLNRIILIILIDVK